MKKTLLLDVVRLSLRLSGRFLAAYGHLKSPHKFTQPQLMTCLVLRAYLKTTYRGVVDFLGSSQELCDAIGLKSLPNYSTLKRFADRSAVAEIADAMFAEIVREFAPDTKEMAVDSTGIQTTAASAYFQTRSGRKNTKYVKLSLAVLCGSLFPCGLLVSWGPRTDRAEAPEILEKAMAKVRPKKLYADAGYDAEWVHAVCRVVDRLHVRRHGRELIETAADEAHGDVERCDLDDRVRGGACPSGQELLRLEGVSGASESIRESLVDATIETPPPRE